MSYPERKAGSRSGDTDNYLWIVVDIIATR